MSKGIYWDRYNQKLTLSKGWALAALFCVLGVAAMFIDTLFSIKLW
jgi:hypothetical protein